MWPNFCREHGLGHWLWKIRSVTHQKTTQNCKFWKYSIIFNKNVCVTLDCWYLLHQLHGVSLLYDGYNWTKIGFCARIEIIVLPCVHYGVLLTVIFWQLLYRWVPTLYHRTTVTKNIFITFAIFSAMETGNTGIGKFSIPSVFLPLLCKVHHNAYL